MKKTTTFEQLRQVAERSKSFANAQNGELAEAVAEAMAELESLKADKPENVSAVIPTTGWNSDNMAVYPYFYDIPAGEITANDIAEIIILPDSLAAAVYCGMCPVNQTLPGKIRVRTAKIPAQQIMIEYNVCKGKE